ncbi:putative 3-deoxy-D-manno-octulosonic acid transferase, mitochondrial [Sesamum angolense]|uniref:3-deoxy-D-manno-octulosonic acid transferase, mitochondrial n=1 Tax=Sesamum angolense TaxID=2727404 RepID=A0AAE1WNC0_9LAMI|nr:putative 3-deoxy-D-manno-octulosonic acid transferase, mitochondrial [Sesamum angolense]
MASKRGEAVYRIYRALTYGVSPLVRLHLRWRKFRGREHSLRWRERLGCPSAPRPTGRLIWFHAVSLGEGLAAIPVIRCCLEMRPDVNVLMTTTTASAFEVIKNRLPSNVIYQFAPLDIPSAVDSFLQYWRPNAVMLMESEIWPNLIMGAARNGIALTLLNGRMSTKSFQNWSHPVILPLITLMLSKFSLILPLSTIQGINFQLLQAPPFIIHYPGDLKCAIANFDISEGDTKNLEQFWAQLSHRKVWMASSIHKGEEKEAHNMLKQKQADILTIIVPRKPQHGQDLALKLQDEGATVALRSRGDNITPGTSIYMVDTLGELRDFYRLTPIAVIGGSFLKGSAGHHVGHFSPMVAEMQRVNPLSVLQVSGEKLVEVVNQLFDNFKILEAHRVAAKQAYLALSSGIVKKFWEMLHFHIFMKSISRADDDVEKLNTTEKDMSWHVDRALVQLLDIEVGGGVSENERQTWSILLPSLKKKQKGK